MKPLINFAQFDAVDLRVGTIIECTVKEGSDKLLRLVVDFGQEGTRVIMTGLKEFYTPEEFQGKQFIFVLNLEPRKMMGEESQGMLLAAESASNELAEVKKPIPLVPSEQTPDGTSIR